jgi:hypothetical protein
MNKKEKGAWLVQHVAIIMIWWLVDDFRFVADDHQNERSQRFFAFLFPVE